ncbi:hypothetical protein DPMN_165745 [Dreissena polymorpha]|uniref:Uncharacterized protein n=1 Tax=Dreissena polymorpha TaxID=45954 RepID=A0A9D4EXR7_DREPO|nr:hypothetical protein DPMN_165745 [Dreissena polymorpha]
MPKRVVSFVIVVSYVMWYDMGWVLSYVIYVIGIIIKYNVIYFIEVLIRKYVILGFISKYVIYVIYVIEVGLNGKYVIVVGFKKGLKRKNYVWVLKYVIEVGFISKYVIQGFALHPLAAPWTPSKSFNIPPHPRNQKSWNRP